MNTLVFGVIGGIWVTGFGAYAIIKVKKPTIYKHRCNVKNEYVKTKIANKGINDSIK